MSLVRAGFVAIPPGASPGFDHGDVYRPGGRIYVAHTGADRVDVIDCDEARFVRSLPDLPGVAGVLVDDEHDLLFTSDREAARVSVYRCSDEELLGRAEVGPHPNGLAYDGRRRRLWAFNLGEPLGENCSATVVDLDSMSAVAELALPGRPRWAEYDRERDRVYANIRQPAQIVVVEPGGVAIERAYAVPSDGPHGLCHDAGRLFCAADGGSLVALNRDTGGVLTSVPLPGVPDVVMHDSALRRLYVAVGDPGVVCSFDTTSDLRHIESVETEAGAHTTAWDPDRRRLYVFCPESCGALVFGETG